MHYGTTLLLVIALVTDTITCPPPFSLTQVYSVLWQIQIIRSFVENCHNLYAIRGVFIRKGNFMIRICRLNLEMWVRHPLWRHKCDLKRSCMYMSIAMDTRKCLCLSRNVLVEVKVPKATHAIDLGVCTACVCVYWVVWDYTYVRLHIHKITHTCSQRLRNKIEL